MHHAETPEKRLKPFIREWHSELAQLQPACNWLSLTVSLLWALGIRSAPPSFVSDTSATGLHNSIEVGALCTRTVPERSFLAYRLNEG